MILSLISVTPFLGKLGIHVENDCLNDNMGGGLIASIGNLQFEAGVDKFSDFALSLIVVMFRLCKSLVKQTRQRI